MKSELSTLIDAAKDIRNSYENYGVSDYMQDYDSQLLGGIHDLIESLNEFESVVEDDEYYEN